jgi:hypothetical protein
MGSAPNYGVGGYGTIIGAGTGSGGGPPSNSGGRNTLAPSTFTYRQLGPNNEPQWGQGQANYLQGTDAVAQAIKTRLLLFEGEWWESQLDGTPWWQSILGVGNTDQQVSLIIQQRILGSPYVTGITNLQVTSNRAARSLGLYAEVQTAFGMVIISNTPQPQAQGIS